MKPGEIIGKLAHKKNINLRQLAIKSDVPYNTLYAMVKRKSERIEPGSLQRIAAALEVPVWELMDDDAAVQYKIKFMDQMRNMGIPVLSQDTLQVAKDYERLDYWGRRHVRATLDIEIERIRQEHPPPPAPEGTDTTPTVPPPESTENGG